VNPNKLVSLLVSLKNNDNTWSNCSPSYLLSSLTTSCGSIPCALAEEKEIWQYTKKIDKEEYYKPTSVDKKLFLKWYKIEEYCINKIKLFMGVGESIVLDYDNFYRDITKSMKYLCSHFCLPIKDHEIAEHFSETTKKLTRYSLIENMDEIYEEFTNMSF